MMRLNFLQVYPDVKPPFLPTHWRYCRAVSIALVGISVGTTGFAQSLEITPPITTSPPSMTFDPIVVTATRSQKTQKNAPIPVSVIDSQTLAENHAHTLKDAIALLPNVNLRQIHGKTGYEVVMQGLGGDQVLVLIDGLPLTASTGSTVNLNQYLNTEVAQIEVIQGASSAQYGSSAMGGVINVITKKLQPNKAVSGHITAEVASNGKQNPSQKNLDNNVTHLDTSLDTKLNATGSLVGRLSAGYHDDAGLSVNHDAWSRIKDTSEQQQITGKLVYRPHPDNLKRQAWVEATQYQEDDTSRFSYYVAPKLLPQQREESIDKTRYAVGFNYQFDKPSDNQPTTVPAKNHLLGGNLQGSLFSEDYQSDSNTYVVTPKPNDIKRISSKEATEKRKTDITTTIAQLQYDLPDWQLKNSTHLLQVGGQWQQDELTQSKNGQSELTGNQVSRNAVEGYLQDDWLLGEKWELVSGIRYQDDSDFGGHVAPKIAVKYASYRENGRANIWRASIGQGYRVPNLKERYYVFDHSNLGYKVIGNPDLQPETSTSYQLGYQTQLNKNLNLAINGYYNAIKDLIQADELHPTYDNNIAIYHYLNVEDATTYGGDISSTWQINPKNLLTTSYAYTHTKNKQTGTELVARPQHTALVTWDNKLNDKLQWINQLRYESKHLVSTTRRAYSPDWWTVNTKLNYQLNPSVTLYAGINNLFDEQKDVKNNDDQSPIDNRQWLAGATFNF